MTDPSIPIFKTTSDLAVADHWDHITARLGWRRNDRHRVEPGLYALGNPTSESPVYVTANYTLSFDAVRAALKGFDAYILVLNTKGINVWCAAGKGSFGTFELTRRIEQTQLAKVVSHRVLILPQLGASGVAAHEVKKQTGFLVKYGPVRAEDLPEYIHTGSTTPEMRQVRFALRDRLVLIPVEVVNLFLPMLLAAVVFYFLGGWMGVGAVAATVLGAAILSFVLFPWIPTHDFSTKGMFVGFLLSLPFVVTAFFNISNSIWIRLLHAIPYLLAMPAVSGFIVLNFTGSSPVASRSGVQREIFKYIPVMAWMAGISIALFLASGILRWIGVSHV
jgi:hypothetical protein